MLRISPKSNAHQAKRSHSVMARSASTQAHTLNRLKQGLQAAAANPNPVPALHQLRHSPLFEEVWQAGKTPIDSSRLDPEAARNHARLAAEAFTTCHALDAVIRLSTSYRITLPPRPRTTAGEAAQANERAFLEQITPDHAKKLIADFHQSWAKNSELRQAAILSALGPETASRLELPCPAAHREVAKTWGVTPPDRQLGMSELLALVDYVNSDTGSFNAVNGAAMAGAYYGDKTLPGMMRVFSAALDGAVAKLCAHPYFGKTDIVTYKGINLNNPSGRFRIEALEAAVGTGKVIAFPNVLSTTADPEQSYAVQKYFDGYTIECRIRMHQAFDADPFHDVLTMGEQEVIGPAGQRFVVIGKQTVEAFQWSSGRNEEIDRYLLEPGPQRPR